MVRLAPSCGLGFQPTLQIPIAEHSLINSCLVDYSGFSISQFESNPVPL